MLKKQIAELIAVGIVVVGLGAACGSTDSDAVRVMQNNTNATLSALTNRLKTAEATITAMSTLATRLANAQSDLSTERARNTDLIARQNAATPSAQQSAGIPVAAGTLPPSDPPSTGMVSVATQPSGGVGTPGGTILDKVVTAKGVDGSSGCAMNETTSFSVNDPKIWVVAYVRGLKKGVVFTSNWSGGDIKKDFTWTADFNSAKTCVNFYIEPKTLGVKPGDWTVSVSASDSAPGTPVTFKVQ